MESGGLRASAGPVQPPRVACGRTVRSDQGMDTEQSPRPDAPNAVLRGGPFDGEQVHVTAPVPVVRFAGLVRHVYEPTADHDEEFPALIVYVHEYTLVY